MIVALLTTWFVDPILAVGAVVVTVTAPRLTGLLAARRRQRQIEAALPDAGEVSAAVTIEFPSRGGHVGFVSGPFPGHIGWLPQRLLHFFDHQE